MNFYVTMFNFMKRMKKIVVNRIPLVKSRIFWVEGWVVKEMWMIVSIAGARTNFKIMMIQLFGVYLMLLRKWEDYLL